jgi:hypothetical protein
MTDEEIDTIWHGTNTGRCGFNRRAFARAIEGLVQYEMLVKQEQLQEKLSDRKQTRAIKSKSANPIYNLISKLTRSGPK